MSARRRELARGRADLNNETIHILRDNLGRADAMITALEGLIERLWNDDGDDDEDGDTLTRRRSHVAHLIEAARLAVRGAIYAGDDLDLHRRGA